MEAQRIALLRPIARTASFARGQYLCGAGPRARKVNLITAN